MTSISDPDDIMALACNLSDAAKELLEHIKNCDSATRRKLLELTNLCELLLTSISVIPSKLSDVYEGEIIQSEPRQDNSFMGIRPSWLDIRNLTTFHEVPDFNEVVSPQRIANSIDLNRYYPIVDDRRMTHISDAALRTPNAYFHVGYCSDIVEDISRKLRMPDRRVCEYILKVLLDKLENYNDATVDPRLSWAHGRSYRPELEFIEPEDINLFLEYVVSDFDTTAWIRLHGLDAEVLTQLKLLYWRYGQVRISPEFDAYSLYVPYEDATFAPSFAELRADNYSVNRRVSVVEYLRQWWDNLDR